MSKSPTLSSEVTFTAESESSSSSAAAPGVGTIAITGGATITTQGGSLVDTSRHIQQITDIKLANGPAHFSVISTDYATTISYEAHATIGKYVQVEGAIPGEQADSTEEASVSLTGDNGATFTASAASEESAE